MCMSLRLHVLRMHVPRLHVPKLHIAKAACACAGVHLKNGKTVEADLVVDATGKDSNVSKWLEKLGQPVPDTVSVASGLRYTYRMYEMTDDPDRDWTVGVCMDHPEYNRTAVVIPVETNKWIVSQLQCTSQCTSHTLLM